MHLWQIRRSVLLPGEQLESARHHAVAARHQRRRRVLSRADERLVSHAHRRRRPESLSTLGVRRVRSEERDRGSGRGSDRASSTDRPTRSASSDQSRRCSGCSVPCIGMVGAFQALSQSAGGNHEELAANISVALVTTLLGLVLAIPCVSLFTFFRNRIDALASEAGQEIERLMLHLESTSSSGPPAARRDAAATPRGSCGMSRRASSVDIICSRSRSPRWSTWSSC